MRDVKFYCLLPENENTVYQNCLTLFFRCQMTSSDKDFRFMATNDLMAELQKDSIKLDDDSERKVSYVVFATFFF